MAGGNWSGQNKVRPGVYINFKSSASPVISPGTRGTVAIPRPMSWGPVAQVMELRPGDDLRPFTGYASTEPQTLFLREMFKGTNVTSAPTKVLLYRPGASGAAPATAELSSKTETLEGVSKLHGTIGNEVEVTCAPSGDKWEIAVSVDGTEVERNTVATAAELSSSWVTFSGTMALDSFQATLAGGTDGTDAVAATAEPVTGITATAAYKGAVGNKLAISCTGSAAPYEITVTLDGVEVDKQSVTTVADFSSKWVTLSGSAALAAFDAVALAGGADGSSTAASDRKSVV